MKKLFTLLLAALCTLGVWAYDFKNGEIYYNITSSNEVEVTYQELSSGSNYYELTTANIPSVVNYQGVDYTVTAIGEWAFAECTTLSSVSLPNTLKRIDAAAFSNCQALPSIVIPEGVTYIGESAFSNCWALTDISVPSTITRIESPYSFDTPWIYDQPDGVIYIGKVLYKYKGDMPANTSIKVKEGTVSICRQAFEDCANLVSITAPNTLNHIGEFALSGTKWLDNQANGLVYLNTVLYTYKGDQYDIPNTVEIQEGTLGIAERALEYGRMESVRIPNTVEVIGDGAFRYCDYLSALDIPNSVTYLGDCSTCPSLETVTIGSGLTDVYKNPFSGCEALHTVVFADGASFVSNFMFAGCQALQNVTLPNSIERIGAGAFIDCKNLQLTSLPSQLTRVEDFTFMGCSSITQMQLHNRITHIGESAFNATNLSEIVLPSSLKTIEREAFNSCPNLTEITIPENVEKITGDLFNGCPLETVKWNAIHCADFGFNEETSERTESPFDSRSYDIQNFTFGDKVKHIPANLCSSLQINEINIPNSVETIGHEAFFYCSNITSITIPENVKSIGFNTFEGCSALTSITWNAKNYQEPAEQEYYQIFSYTNEIKSLTIGSAVTTIPSFVKDFNQLTTLQVASGNTTFDSRQGCNAIIETASNTLIKGCNTSFIPEGVEHISKDAFIRCKEIKSITLPTTLKTIGESAFYGCKSLTDLNIPTLVNSIGQEAFSSCAALRYIAVDKNNTTYDSRENCNAIIQTASNTLLYGCKNTIIPNTVKGIGTLAFSECDELKYIDIPSSVDSIGMGAFNECEMLEHVILHSGLKKISTGAFLECEALKSINIPNTVTELGRYAFLNCYMMTEATIGAGVETIGEGAFGECLSLKRLHIGANVKSMGDWALAYCEQLDTIYCYATVPPTTGEECFDDTKALVLFVPCSAVEAYQSHEAWKNAAYRIECIGSEQVDAEEVEVSSTTSTVTITWPTEDNADTYTLVINKDGDVFCRLTFDKDGKLINIAFVPGREANHPALAAEQVGSGLRFTVTGLDEGTNYGYNITAKDAANNTIQSHEGAFTTQTTTAVDDIYSPSTDIRKWMKNGQLIIIRDGVEYNAVGERL